MLTVKYSNLFKVVGRNMELIIEEVTINDIDEIVKLKKKFGVKWKIRISML